ESGLAFTLEMGNQGSRKRPLAQSEKCLRPKTRAFSRAAIRSDNPLARVQPQTPWPPTDQPRLPVVPSNTVAVAGRATRAAPGTPAAAFSGSGCDRARWDGSAPRPGASALPDPTASAGPSPHP